MTAMPLLLGVLCLMAIAYRYYSAFLAAKVATLDDTRETPAYRLKDGHNFHPTNKWVLFGHHFAAISGAGPLIGPVLAAQFGYLPGLLWIVIGVCLAGAVQDFLVLVMSTRRDGRSLAQMAFTDAGKIAGIAATIAILFIIVVALAGLGKVVVKALGGETVAFPAETRLVLPAGQDWTEIYRESNRGEYLDYQIPKGSTIFWAQGKQSMSFSESFTLSLAGAKQSSLKLGDDRSVIVPAGAVRLVPGSSWGTFTIAATIPIALFVGIYMYKIRPGRVVEASLIGGALTLAATFAGGWVADHSIGQYFNLSTMQVTIAMAIYGFVASVLPVWVLLCPRDYLSSFLKIGTIVVLVLGVLIANPKLEAPAFNHHFSGGGPVVSGDIFPFLFITIMCGAISGFHALVSSGTTPKMLSRESQARTIGYGAMLIEGLVGVIAMIAAASLPVRDYYGMNTDLALVPKWNDQILQVAGAGGVEHLGQYEELTRESLRGRTGGAVTLAVGMAHIFDQAIEKVVTASQPVMNAMWRYWYHFAIMFEALFILTTIDTGTRIGRFLLQEVMGKVHPSLGLKGGYAASIISTAVIVIGWAWFMNSGNFGVIWNIFGVANQVLAVIALAIVSACLASEKRVKYLWVTIVPMIVVIGTTSTAAIELLSIKITAIKTQWEAPASDFRTTALFTNTIQATLLIAMMLCAAIVLISVASRIWKITRPAPVQPQPI